ncbi:hypothetical protein A7982_13893 [Minicystis rosea]|nr:hypothetical protein A7982_13893 [Minicystis rosea]
MHVPRALLCATILRDLEACARGLRVAKGPAVSNAEYRIVLRSVLT